VAKVLSDLLHILLGIFVLAMYAAGIYLAPSWYGYLPPVGFYYAFVHALKLVGFLP